MCCSNFFLLVYCIVVVWQQSTVASIARPSQRTLNCCFSASPLAEDRPEMSQLQRFVGVAGRPIKVVEEVSPDWEKLALALRFRGGVIRAVRRNEHFQVEAACRNILQRWLDGELGMLASYPASYPCQAVTRGKSWELREAVY